MAFFRSINANQRNLLFDITLALAFVIEMEARFTGLHVHEVLGIVIAAAFVIHLVLHWQWVIGVTKQFISTPLRLRETRLKYLLNLAVFIDLAVSIVSGIMISSTLGFTLLSDPRVYNDARFIHIGSSRLSLLLIGLHIAMDWKWIVATTRKCLFQRGFLPAKPASVDGERSSEIGRQR